MIINKNDKFKRPYNDTIYYVVGKWCGNYVLSLKDSKDLEECLIYCKEDMIELIDGKDLIKI